MAVIKKEMTDLEFCEHYEKIVHMAGFFTKLNEHGTLGVKGKKELIEMKKYLQTNHLPYLDSENNLFKK